MFKNLMAKLGKGAAKVDLVLERQNYLPGDEVRGELVIEGGTIEQKINQVDVDLTMIVQVKEQEINHTIERFPFHESFTVQPEARKTLPFSYVLPKDLPLSGNKVAYFFTTHLDIASGVDHSDHDFLKIHPPLRLQKVLAALSELGLREKHDSRSFNGYAQEFALFPTAFLQGRAEEVEFVAAVEEAGIRLLLELDLFSWAGEQEVRREIWLENKQLDNPDELTQLLKDALSEMAENPSSFLQPRHFQHGGHKHSGLSKGGGTIGGFAAGAIGGLVLAQMMDGVGEEIAEAADIDLPEIEDTGEFFDDVGDFFGGDE
ncbi:sporulation protein [Salinithrix halophila]|uniref:Sporulation protein n=1 Tax=Salinithrix halophila TaxID=1485204 RepID=A0ABV8JFG4_9BACL